MLYFIYRGGDIPKLEVRGYLSSFFIFFSLLKIAGRVVMMPQQRFIFLRLQNCAVGGNTLFVVLSMILHTRVQNRILAYVFLVCPCQYSPRCSGNVMGI